MGLEKNKYKITVESLGEKWKEEGLTIESTLAKFPLSWENIKGKGILTIRYGAKSHEHLFNAIQLRRVFSNKVVRAGWARKLKFLLDSGKKTNIPE